MANPKDRAAQDQAPPIARHEFGHYVVARSLGFKVGDVSLEITYPNFYTGSSSIELHTSLVSLNEVVVYIENRIVVLYAGCIAETIAGGKSNRVKARSLLTGTASNDYAKVRELMRILRSIKFPTSMIHSEIQTQYSTIEFDLFNRSQTIVDTEAELVVALAKMLSNKITKSGRKEVVSESELNASSLITNRFP